MADRLRGSRESESSGPLSFSPPASAAFQPGRQRARSCL